MYSRGSGRGRGVCKGVGRGRDIERQSRIRSEYPESVRGCAAAALGWMLCGTVSVALLLPLWGGCYAAL